MRKLLIPFEVLYRGFDGIVKLHKATLLHVLKVGAALFLSFPFSGKSGKIPSRKKQNKLAALLNSRSSLQDKE